MPTAVTTALGRGVPRIRSSLVAIGCVLVAVLVVSVPVASARHAATHAYAFSFQSPYGVPAGERGLASIAVDEESGSVYLENSANGSPLEKYSADGVPTPFTAPEANSSNTISTPGAGGYRHPEVEVDNSGNPATDGRIFLIAENPGVEAFLPDGERVGGHFPIAGGARDVAIEPGTGNLWVIFDSFTSTLTEYTPSGEPTGVSFELDGEFRKVSMDSHGTFYLTPEYGLSYKFHLSNEQLEPFTEGADIAIDPQTNDAYVDRGGEKIAQYGEGGGLLFEFGAPPSGFNGIAALGVNGTNGKVYRGINGTIDVFNPGSTITLPDSTTKPVTNFQAESVTLHGIVNPDGEATTECYFEWGTSTSYGNKAPCAEGGIFSGTANQQVSAHLEGLTKGTVYHYRVVAVNSNGKIGGLDESFTPSALPTFSDEHVSDVHSDSVVLRGSVDPEGAPTHWNFEYGTADCASSSCASTPVEVAPLGITPQAKSVKVTGLQPGTTYHYRFVAENQTGPAAGSDHTFTTFPLTTILKDSCANAHVRQQTGAALLLDCRAYELTSALNAGGYDVESVLVPGQEPFGGYPAAADPSRVLYAVHDGAIPGAGNPPNRGIDTYVATRGNEGWTTRYVGVPSDDPFATHSFASGLLEADSGLDAFAYGGEGICEPCFEDGSTNIPLRLPNGELVEGIAGSQSPEPAEPAGHVGRYFSADGSHFVFGTTTQLEPAGNENGDVTIYERDLDRGGTEVVSTLPGGETMTGAGTGELDVSSDGSRVIVGQRVSTDAAGNEYWHPYMHLAGSSHSIDLTPGGTAGVLYAGMTADGSKVFFTTTDRLLPADTDNSADLYEAEVDGAGPVSLKLLSGGSTPPTGNTDACDPAPNADGNNWNAVGIASGNSCGVVAIGGGGGLASQSGTIYFLSPEALDGSGVAGEPNLFVVSPGGAPHLVTTLEPENPLVKDAVREAGERHYGDFQVTPDGRYAAFSTSISLTGFDNGGYSEVFRYDAEKDALVCASCNPTNARALGASTLPRDGLGLSEGGLVFFDSGDAIAPRDLDERVDAYEYEDGNIQLVSTGASPFDSRMLGISEDGTDAYFFTRDTLAPQDENGDLVKVYDARAGGGFPYVEPEPPCKAADECHGPGTVAPPPPGIRTIRGSGGNEGEGETSPPPCKRHFVRRHGRCVKVRHSHHKPHRSQKHHHGTPRHG